MKKGFTLIELLGVMVLLGLLGLITAPVILNAIEDSKKNTFSFAANTILHQINEYYEEQKAEFGFDYEGEFLDISNEFIQKRLKFPESTINQGDVYISSDGEIAMYITDGNWCASKGNDTNKVSIDKGNSCFVDNVLKNEFVDLMDKDYHSFKVSIVSPKNQNFTKYEFQVNGGEWINNGSNKEYSHNVSKAGIYTIKSRLTNSSNAVTETYITNILIEPIKSPVFAAFPSGDGWSKSKEVSIKSDDDLSIFYSLNGNSYVEYSSSLKFNETGVIYSYVTDGVLNSETVTYYVNKIDNTIPIIDSIGQFTDSILIKASDDNSGIAGYCINSENSSESCNWILRNSNTYQHDISTMDSGKYYVFVKDKANNISLVKDFKTAPGVLASITSKVPNENDIETYENGQLINLGTYGIRYQGSDPDNYIYFNCEDYSNQTSETCETWRIIGVVDGKVKIISEEIGEMAWNDQDGDGDFSDWNNSTLKAYLNGEYYESLTEATRNSNYISPSTWYLRGHTTSDVTKDVMYNLERTTGTVMYETPYIENTKLGIMYPSDWGYAAMETSTCLATTILSIYSSCKPSNWINQGSTNNQWLIVPFSVRYTLAFRAFTDGCVGSTYSVYSSSGVRVVLHLSSDVGLDGEGTSNSPFKLIP